MRAWNERLPPSWSDPISCMYDRHNFIGADKDHVVYDSYFKNGCGFIWMITYIHAFDLKNPVYGGRNPYSFRCNWRDDARFDVMSYIQPRCIYCSLFYKERPCVKWVKNTGMYAFNQLNYVFIDRRTSREKIGYLGKENLEESLCFVDVAREL